MGVCSSEGFLFVASFLLCDCAMVTGEGRRAHPPGGGGGGGGTRPWCWFVCLWRRPLGSRHCSSRPSVGLNVFWLCQRSPRMTCPVGLLRGSAVPETGGGGGQTKDRTLHSFCAVDRRAIGVRPTAALAGRLPCTAARQRPASHWRSQPHALPPDGDPPVRGLTLRPLPHTPCAAAPSSTSPPAPLHPPPSQTSSCHRGTRTLERSTETAAAVGGGGGGSTPQTLSPPPPPLHIRMPHVERRIPPPSAASDRGQRGPRAARPLY